MGSSSTWATSPKNSCLGGIINNSTADRYLDHLRTAVLPDLIAIFPDPDSPQNLDRRIWFQQNGAPPHYGVNVRDFWITVTNFTYIFLTYVKRWRAK